MKITYIAKFEAEDDGYVVTFPDVPGVTTEGDNLDEAIYMAEDALKTFSEQELDEGRQLKSARPLSVVVKDEGQGPHLFMAITVEVKSKAKPVPISFQPHALKRIDKYAEEKGLTRSGLLMAATLEYMQKHK